MDTTSRFAEELRALDELLELPDGPEVEARRKELNARIRDKAREDVAGLRAFLESLDIREPQPAEEAMLMIEALIGQADEWIDLLQASLQRFAAVAEANPRNRIAPGVLVVYGFLEGFPDRRMHLRLLPDYLALSRSPHVLVRRQAMVLLMDYEPAQLGEVYKAFCRLLRDSDWWIRRDAQRFLEEERLLPADHRVSVADRIRRALLDRQPGS